MRAESRIAHSWQATEDEIMRLCAYITDDSTVAAYFGTTRGRVLRVRAKMTKRQCRAVPEVTPKHEETINASTRKEECAAEDGSRRLLMAIECLFERFAHRHGLTIEKARDLQLGGYRA